MEYARTIMKQTLCISTLCLMLLCCHSQAENAANNTAVLGKTDEEIKLHKLKKLFTTGDFDGDGKQDTVFQHNYSALTKTEIEYSADPFQNEWDTVINWFYHQEAAVYLTMNKNNADTLYLGTGQGLYCLVNIGDNNADGQDEIALVIDYLDFSRVNSCKIYALCKGKWTLVKQFAVHESSFEFNTDREPVFYQIDDFLEKEGGKWVYKDYLDDGADTAEDVGKMLPLKIDPCK